MLRNAPKVVRVALVSLLAIGIATVASPAAHARSRGFVPAIGISPKFRLGGRPDAGHANRFSCQDTPLGGGACYSPAQIRRAYSFDSLQAHGIDGRGRTVAIVDAFTDPYLRADLATFDRTFGLPDPNLTVVTPDGSIPFDITDENQVGWALETSLDVQWVHAIAPQARILLVQSYDDNDPAIDSAIKYVIDGNRADALSQSFGETETCAPRSELVMLQSLYARAAARGMTVTAATGDAGAAVYSCDGNSFLKGVEIPAVDPNVLAVGGTNLALQPKTDRYSFERAWGSEAFGCVAPDGCSGGGYSTLVGRPSYQDGTVAGRFRAIPDVSMDAGVDGGLLVHCGACNVFYDGLAADDPAFQIIGGTSASTPMWASIAVLADQLRGDRVGRINDDVYKLLHSRSYQLDFHDVTQGNNNQGPIAGYAATPGWDPVTGVGTPVGDNLVVALAQRNRRD